MVLKSKGKKKKGNSQAFIGDAAISAEGGTHLEREDPGGEFSFKPQEGPDSCSWLASGRKEDANLCAAPSMYQEPVRHFAWSSPFTPIGSPGIDMCPHFEMRKLRLREVN